VISLLAIVVILTIGLRASIQPAGTRLTSRSSARYLLRKCRWRDYSYRGSVPVPDNPGMQIDVSAEHYAGLVRRAVAAGYGNVEALLAALANEPTADPRGKLSEDEVRRSAAECDCGIQAIEAGGGHDLRDAMLELGRQRGFGRAQ